MPRKKYTIFYYFLYFLWNLLFTNKAFAQNSPQQSFRLTPQNVEVVARHDVTLRCEVNNQRGQAQWTQDGFAFGFDREIPGFSRFSIIGNEAEGVHNLRIRNVTLDDDGEYQCQVTPMLPSHAIRASATLTVLLPPTDIEMVGHVSGTAMTVKAGDSFSLECIARNAKPAPKIHWFRGSERIREANQEDKEEESSEPQRKNLKSRISITPTHLDNNVVYMCRTSHPALRPVDELSASVTLDVQYEPGNPEITGYIEGDIVRAETKKTLTCRSRGGNPLPEVFWYKNGRQIDTDFVKHHSYTVNEYEFNVSPSDNNAKYECHVQNVMTAQPKKADIIMRVNFSPTSVNISSPDQVNVGDVIAISCVAENSNPPADVSLLINGQPPPGVTSRQHKTPDGGFTTISNISGYEVGPMDSDLTVNCYAANQPLGTTKVDTKIITVLRPPSPPIILGYEIGTVLRKGDRRRLTCRSSGGNPLPDLKWFKGTKALQSKTMKDGGSSTSHLTITLDMSDNGAEYRCEASNSATTTPLSNSTTLTVMYPPTGVKVEVKPLTPKTGEFAVLTCNTTSAFPKANISWWRDGFQVDGWYGPEKAGLYQGTITSYSINISITPELNKEIFTCQADNGFGSTTHDAIILDVHFKPIIELNQREIQVKEGEDVVIEATANGNPEPLSYTWKKGSDVVMSGKSLNISQVTKDVAGVYVLEVTNLVGTSRKNVTVIVKYSPIITEVTHRHKVNPGSKVTLECMFEGSPQVEVEWKRSNYDMSKTETVSYSGKSVLYIGNVSSSDTGFFECHVKNEVGESVMPNVSLVVNQIPEADESPTYKKAASELGGIGHLRCRVKASPSVFFTWFTKDHEPIDSDVHPRYEILPADLVDNLYTYESVLLVKNVTMRDHGFFLCQARNSLGFITTHIHLEGTTRPDPPLDLKILNITHDSVLLTWIPGFDGGLQQTFRVRYQILNSFRYLYMDVYPSNATRFWVTDLGLGETYDFSLVSINSKGESDYSQGSVRGTTLSESPYAGSMPPGTTARRGRIPSLVIVIITLVGAALLVLNVALVTCFFKRKARKRMTGSPPLTEMEKAISRVLADKGNIPKVVTLAVSTIGGLLVIVNVVLVACVLHRRRNKSKDSPASSDKGSSKSTTIEMYAPSSYTGTVTGETLSSISEKSRESYTNEDSADDYDVEAARVAAASTYLIEQLEPPPQYASRPPPHMLSQQNAHNDLNIDGQYDENLRRNQYNTALDHVPGYGTLGRRVPSSSVSDHYIPGGSDQYSVASSRYNTYIPQGSNHSTQVPISGHGHPHYNGSLRRNVPHKLHFPKDYIRNGSMNNVGMGTLSPTGSTMSPTGNGTESSFTGGTPTHVSPTRSNPPSLSTFSGDHVSQIPQNGGGIIPMEQRGHLV